VTIVYLTAAWLAGIYLGSLLGRFFVVSGLLRFLWLAASLPLFVAYLWRQHPRVRACALGSLFLLLGAIRCVYALHLHAPDLVDSYNDAGWVCLRGVVCREPDPRDRYVNLVLSVSSLEKGSERFDVGGKVLLKAARYPAYAYGDELEVRGFLETPPEFEDFSYREYLAHQGIHSVMRRPSIAVLGHGKGNPLKAVLYAAKAHLYAVLGRMMPEPESSLLAGILLGMDRLMPQRVSDAFRTTGVLHIVVISGFNITIVAGWIWQSARRILGARYATWVALGGIALYTLLVGADPPVVRAAIMGSLTLIAYQTGRPGVALASLAVALLGMTLLDPDQLWSVSFQLSAMATLGLIVLVPRLEGWSEALLRRCLGAEWAVRLTGLLSDALLVTLAAQITTLPLIVYHFRQLSLVSLLTNLLVLPVQPAIMVLGVVSVLLGTIWFPLGQACGWAAWLFLTYTIRVAEALAALPHAAVPLGRVTFPWLGLYYLLLWLLLLQWKPQPRPDEEARPASGLTVRARRSLLGLSVAAALVWVAVLTLPDGRLHVCFMDVGEGDAILIRTPDGKTILLDGGPSPSVLMSELGRRLPFWDRRVDLVILSHPDDDHISGLLPVLERYDVGQVMEPGWKVEAPPYRAWEGLIQGRSIRRTFPRAGARLDLGRGAWMTVLHPGYTWIKGSHADTNNNGLVIRLQMGKASFLFPADIEAEAERRLVSNRANLDCVVLKVPHHGSDTSLTEAFLRAANPQVGIISVGRDNRFGHPAAATIARLHDAGVLILRTDELGSIELTTDGRSYSIKTMRAYAPR